MQILFESTKKQTPIKRYIQGVLLGWQGFTLLLALALSALFFISTQNSFGVISGMLLGYILRIHYDYYQHCKNYITRIVYNGEFVFTIEKDGKIEELSIHPHNVATYIKGNSADIATKDSHLVINLTENTQYIQYRQGEWTEGKLEDIANKMTEIRKS